MDLYDLLAESGHVASRADLVAALGRHRVDNAIKSGQLAAVFPRTYAAPWNLDQPDVRRRAALLSVGGQAALSHLTALERYDLPVPDGHPIHVTAYNPRHPRGVPGQLVVHRTLLPLEARELDGLPVTRVESSLLTSWPLLPPPEQRAPLILAAQRGLVSPLRLARQADAMWWLPGRAGVRELVGLLLAGCESELELWGYRHVFDVPGLDDAARQRVVRVRGHAYRLDMAYEDELLAVELDGRRFHSSALAWERDIARDTALATAGWQTIRLSHARLHGDPDGCRRDVLAVRSARGRRSA